jgi:hypothetical protein
MFEIFDHDSVRFKIIKYYRYLLYLLFFINIFHIKYAYPECQSCDEKADQCCLDKDILSEIVTLGKINREKVFKDRPISVGRWQSGSVDKMLQEVLSPNSSLEKRNEFFDFYKKKPRDGSNRAGRGLYAVLPFDDDGNPELGKYKQFYSSNSFSDSSDPSYNGLVLAGNFSFIEQNKIFYKKIQELLKKKTTKNNKNKCDDEKEGNLWSHFDRWCTDLLGDNVVYSYSDKNSRWISILGMEPISSYKSLEEMLGGSCQELSKIIDINTNKSKEFAGIEEHNLEYLKNKKEKICNEERLMEIIKNEMATNPEDICNESLMEKTGIKTNDFKDIMGVLYKKRTRQKSDENLKLWKLAYECSNPKSFTVKKVKLPCSRELIEKCSKYKQIYYQMNDFINKVDQANFLDHVFENYLEMETLNISSISNPTANKRKRECTDPSSSPIPTSSSRKINLTNRKK